jgi:adenylate cyclase
LCLQFDLPFLLLCERGNADRYAYNTLMRDLFRQLSDRRVIRVGIGYLVGAWLTMQLVDVIFPAMGLPDWSITLMLGILAAGFPLALILSWVFDVTPRGIERTEDTALPEVTSATGPSIAVLPFPDMSAEKDQEHFCDGLTEELLNVLTRIPNLRVASRTSSFSMKNKDVDLKYAAQKLQVAHILEGSVRKSGNRVRITAQLIEVETDSHLWSETYDRELDDIFAIQDDIAACILEALQCRLGTEQLTDPTTQNPKAYEYFLRGRGYAISGSERDRELGAEMYRKAVDLDPGFIRAWIHLAEECALISTFFAKDDKWSGLAEEAAQKAIQLAPDHSESFLARGYAHAANGRFAESERDLQKAVELDPTRGRAYHHLARAQYHQGNIQRAVENFDKATEYSPDDYESPLLAVSLYESIGDPDNARRVAGVGVERAEKILQDYPDNQRAYYLGSSGLSILEQHDRAKEWVERALAINYDDSATRYNAACLFLRYGDTERALDCLENSVVSRTWFENDPDLDSLRDHPRFKAILAALPD